MKKSTIINLELMKDVDAGIKFYAKQFDDLKLQAKIFNGLDEVNIEGQKITVCIIKEDKTVIEQTKDIIIEDNAIIVNLSKQATTSLGKCSMEILLSDEEGTASTTTVSYMVSEKLASSIVEIIKSEDDINVLNLIEEFIETSNVDILDIKEAIKELRETVDKANTSIDVELETIIGRLREVESSIMESIRGTADEVTATVNNAVKEVDEVLVKVEEAKGFIEEIDTIKTNTLSSIEEAKTDSLETIRDNGNGVVRDLTSLSDTIKGDISNLGNAETNNILEARSGALEEIEGTKTVTVNAIKSEITKVEEEFNVSVSEVKKQVETDLNACKSDLDSYLISLKAQGKIDLDAIKDTVIEEVNVLKGQIDNSLSSLSEKIIESDSNIEELTALIEEAKEVAGLVRLFIENNRAVDLSNYYTKEEVDTSLLNKVDVVEGKELSSNDFTDELKEKLEGLENVNLDNYYDKETIDEKLDTYKGIVAENKTLYKPYPEGFEEAFKKMVEEKTYEKHYTGTVIGFIAGNIGNRGSSTAFKHQVLVVIHRANFVTKDSEFHITEFYNSGNILGVKTNGEFKTSSQVNAYLCPMEFVSSTGAFIQGTKPSSHYSFKEFYYSDFIIYNDLDSKEYPPSIETITTIDDFNSCINTGTYKVNVYDGDSIPNAPETLSSGILIVEKADKIIKQILTTTDNIKYRRIYDGASWSEWKKELTEEDILKLISSVNNE